MHSPISRALRRALAAASCAAAIGVAAAVPTIDAAACSICLAGDPIFDSQGVSAQQQGDLTAYLEVRGWSKRAAALPHGHGDDDDDHDHHGFERATDQQLNASLAWTPVDRATLSLNLPVAFNHMEMIAPGERMNTELTGVGDLAFNASLVAWRNRDVLPSSWLEARVMVKAPTGESSRADKGMVDKHLQAGTGSWDTGAGVAGIHRLAWGTAYASVMYRVNTEGSLDYEYGDVLLANAALLVPLGHATGMPELARLTAGAELNFRWAERDRFRGNDYEDSGGSILYIT
ncbi:MAG TPA: hypothetical protein VEC18_02440, partial [Myxococcota bacterium]|nr:hypothetical protein [Myxococcota bacterium]